MMRKSIKPGLYRDRFSQVRPANAQSRFLLDLRNGTFTRASSGSYHNGSTSSIAFAAPNQMRFEDRGDGYGSLLLLEGSRTNLAIYSEDFFKANWLNANASKFTSSAATPYGDIQEIISVSGTLANSRIQHSIASTGWPNHTTGTISAFMIASGSDLQLRQVIVGKDGVERSSPEFSVNGSWNRFSLTDTNASGGASVHLIHIARHSEATGGPSEWITWGAQAEIGNFPTSYISTSNVTATRAADVLTFANGTWPNEIRTTGFEFDVYPGMSSDEFKSGGIGAMTLIDFYPGGSQGLNGLGIRYAGGASIYFRIYIGGVQVLTPTSAQAWNRHQKITLRCEPNAGRLSISGCIAGDGVYSGTAGTYPTGSLTVFATQNGISPFFGRISNLRKIN